VRLPREDVGVVVVQAVARETAEPFEAAVPTDVSEAVVPFEAMRVTRGRFERRRFAGSSSSTPKPPGTTARCGRTSDLRFRPMAGAVAFLVEASRFATASAMLSIFANCA
jgi:hypothetical protein